MVVLRNSTIIIDQATDAVSAFQGLFAHEDRLDQDWVMKPSGHTVTFPIHHYLDSYMCCNYTSSHTFTDLERHTMTPEDIRTLDQIDIDNLTVADIRNLTNTVLRDALIEVLQDRLDEVSAQASHQNHGSHENTVTQ